MTNEELVLLIQGGNNAHYGELWEQIRRYVAVRAKTFYGNGARFIRCDIDDLIQAGYLAMVDAVETYDPQRASFITHYNFYLRKSFMATAIGVTEKSRNDPIFTALDIDGEIYDDGGVTLEEVIPGNAPDPEQTSIETVYNLELRQALNAAMDRRLTPEEKDVLQRHFMQGQTLKECGEAHGVSTERARQLKERALRKMRSGGTDRALRAFITERTPFYMRISVSRFNMDNYSSVEKIAELRERLANYYINRNSFTG